MLGKITSALFVLLVSGAHRAYGCSVCFGANGSAAVYGLKAAIVTLLGILLGIIGCFIVFFINVQRRARITGLKS